MAITISFFPLATSGETTSPPLQTSRELVCPLDLLVLEEMNGKKNHQGKRQERRRQASYMVKQNLTIRKSIPDEDIHEFYQAINDNNLSKFGIIKLSSYLLETSFILEGIDEVLTLMKYAVRKDRDKIINALLRGGCDPSVYPHLKTQKSSHIVTSLSSFPPGYSVWLVKYVYQMIDQSLKSPPGDSKCCSKCESKNCINDIAEDRNILLRWVCGHETCYSCTWEAVCKPLIECCYALRCPICNVRSDGGSDMIYLEELSESDTEIQSLVPHQRSEYSLSHWLHLPSESLSEEETEEHSLIPNKRPPFVVGPLYQVSKYLIGTTKEQRLLEFHRAIMGNNIYRMYWIFLAGIDINAKNQCGQTGLMIAATLGYLDALKFLLWCGGDPLVRDNISSNIYRTAYQYNHLHICNYLELNLSKDILNELQSNSHQSLSYYDFENNNFHPTITCVIDESSPLIDGRCSYYIDNCFSDLFLNYLDTCFNYFQPDHHQNKQTCPLRYHLYDSENIIQRVISSVLSNLHHHNSNFITCHQVFPHMKYLCYTTLGTRLAPHIDLSKYDPIHSISSTHTLIIYLTNCFHGGGETILLDHISNPTISYPIIPKRGRMLIFPHHCPHEGGVITHVPKILLRCEGY